MAELERIGLVPAGGVAQRVGPLPCSKEIYPLGFAPGAGGAARPLTACEELLAAIRLGGARKAFVVLGEGKWDVLGYVGEGAAVNVDVAYLTIRRSPSTVATVERAFPFLDEALVLFGFPDILFEPRDAFAEMVDRQRATGAAVVLGIFPTDRPDKVDTVRFDRDGRVRDVLIKQRDSPFSLAWIIAVWTPDFTRFLHDRAATVQVMPGRELYVGDMIREAIQAGLPVASVAFPQGRFRDIGTPEDLRAAVFDYCGEPLPTAR